MSKVMRLAVRLEGSRSGLSIDDMETGPNVSRRTVERLRDSVEQSFGPLEEVETGEARDRNAGDFGPTRYACSSALLRGACRVRIGGGRPRPRGTDRTCKGDSWGCRQTPRAVASQREAETEDDLDVLVRTEGLAMRAGPRTHLQVGLLPLLREAPTAGLVVELEYDARTVGATTP